MNQAPQGDAHLTPRYGSSQFQLEADGPREVPDPTLGGSQVVSGHGTLETSRIAADGNNNQQINNSSADDQVRSVVVGGDPFAGARPYESNKSQPMAADAYGAGDQPGRSAAQP